MAAENGNCHGLIVDFRLWVRPIHIIILGLLIACASVAWQYYKDTKTAFIYSETTPAQIPHAPLAFEERQFRLELRKFVSSLDEVYKKLGREIYCRKGKIIVQTSIRMKDISPETQLVSMKAHRCY